MMMERSTGGLDSLSGGGEEWGDGFEFGGGGGVGLNLEQEEGKQRVRGRQEESRKKAR